MGGVDLASLLLGAGATIATQSFLAYFITPHVDARTRSRERWEQDVVALGDLLGTEILPMRVDASNAAHMYARLQLQREDGQPVGDAEIQSAGRAVNELSDKLLLALRGRGEWLLSRVEACAPRGATVDGLRPRFEWILHRCMNLPLSAAVHVVQQDAKPELLRDRWDREHENEMQLLAELRQLASTPKRRPRLRLGWANRRRPRSTVKG